MSAYPETRLDRAVDAGLAGINRAAAGRPLAGDELRMIARAQHLSGLKHEPGLCLFCEIPRASNARLEVLLNCGASEVEEAAAEELEWRGVDLADASSGLLGGPS